MLRSQVSLGMSPRSCCFWFFDLPELLATLDEVCVLDKLQDITGFLLSVFGSRSDVSDGVVAVCTATHAGSRRILYQSPQNAAVVTFHPALKMSSQLVPILRGSKTAFHGSSNFAYMMCTKIERLELHVTVSVQC